MHAPLYNDVMVPAAVWKGTHRETPCVRSVKEQSRKKLVTRSDRYATRGEKRESKQTRSENSGVSSRTSHKMDVTQNGNYSEVANRFAARKHRIELVLTMSKKEDRNGDRYYR